MNKSNPYYRIIAIIIMLASIIWGYWWLVWILAIVFLFIFPLYYEIIVWGIMYDALYGIGMSYTFTASCIVLFVITFFLRKKLVTYKN